MISTEILCKNFFFNKAENLNEQRKIPESPILCHNWFNLEILLIKVPLKSLFKGYFPILHIILYEWLFDCRSSSRLDTEMYKDVEDESQSIILITMRG